MPVSHVCQFFFEHLLLPFWVDECRFQNMYFELTLALPFWYNKCLFLDVTVGFHDSSLSLVLLHVVIYGTNIDGTVFCIICHSSAYSPFSCVSRSPPRLPDRNQSSF